MKKYKLNNDKKQSITDEQIGKYKNFEKLTANYDYTTKYSHRKPFYKNPKAFAALVFILLIIWLLISQEEAETAIKSNKQTEVSK
jgi:hypothetical protein